MTQKYFKTPFALAGTKTAIPESRQTDGNVSYNQGWGPDYELDSATDASAKNVDRNTFNQIFSDLTDSLKQLQDFGAPDFITSADNGGAAFSYSNGVRVRYAPAGSTSYNFYRSKTNNNTQLPTVSTHWNIDNESGESPYDIPFNAGIDGDQVAENLEIKHYGSMVMARGVNVESVVARIETNPAGANITFDITSNNVSIYSTKPTISTSGTYNTGTIIAGTRLLKNTITRFVVTGIGTSTSGAGLRIGIKGNI